MLGHITRGTALLTLSAIAQAQTPPTTLPKFYTNTTAPDALSIPLGRTKFFGQTWYRGDSLVRNSWIRQIGWRTDEHSASKAETVRLEIVLDNTGTSWNGLQKTFANNLTAPVTFFSMKTVNLPATPMVPNPNVPSVWIPGDAPFRYRGPNLIVQVDNQTSANPGTSRYRLDGFSQDGGIFWNMQSGQGCSAAELTSNYTANNYIWRLQVTSAPPGSNVTFYLGWDNQKWGGKLLPYDLTTSGMPGCDMGINPIWNINRTADATGTATLDLRYRAGGNALILFGQAFHSHHNNAAGIATTNVASTLLGAQGVANYLYNWDRFGPQAQYGPYSTNRAPILLVK